MLMKSSKDMVSRVLLMWWDLDTFEMSAKVK